MEISVIFIPDVQPAGESDSPVNDCQLTMIPVKIAVQVSLGEGMEGQHIHSCALMKFQKLPEVEIDPK